MKTFAAAVMAAFLFATSASADQIACRPMDQFKAIWASQEGKLDAFRPLDGNDPAAGFAFIARGLFVGDFDHVAPATDKAGQPWLVFAKGDCFVAAFRLGTGVPA